MIPSLSLFVHYIIIIILNYATLLLMRLGLKFSKIRLMFWYLIDLSLNIQ